MQEKFTAALIDMNKAIKNPEDTETTDLLQKLEKDVGGEEVTAEVFALQEQKAQLMGELQGALQQLDTEGTVGEEGKMRKVVADEAGGLSIYGKGGEMQSVSQGQLMVAGMWGESYFLGQTVSYEVKKKYLIQDTHYKIADIFDHQISVSEGREDSENKSKKSYNAISRHYDEGAKIPLGIKAEKMVQSFLTKLTYDYDMPYRLKSVSAYEDVEYKIDFIIEPVITDEEKESMKSSVGVNVVEPENRPDIAIQFTTDSREKNKKHKQGQITEAKEKIEEEGVPIADLILVALPIGHVEDVFNEWQNTKGRVRVPGGPDELWGEEVQSEIFEGILGEVFSEKQAKEAWDRVANSEK